MSEARTRTDLSVSTQDNLRKQFEEKNAVISIGMDHGKYQYAISFAIDLLREEVNSSPQSQTRWPGEEK